MKLKNLVAPLLLSCAIFCSARQDSLSGKWIGTLRQADSTAYPLTYNFTLIGDSVSGTAASPLGEFPIDQGKLDTAGLHFKVTVNGLDVYHNGTVYADSIGMNLKLNGSTVHCRLDRAAN
jgi:hypothetical protein